MATTQDWRRNKDMWIRILERQTGEGLAAWNGKMRKQGFAADSNGAERTDQSGLRWCPWPGGGVC